jgi:hypothetical protein
MQAGADRSFDKKATEGINVTRNASDLCSRRWNENLRQRGACKFKFSSNNNKKKMNHECWCELNKAPRAKQQKVKTMTRGEGISKDRRVADTSNQGVCR